MKIRQTELDDIFVFLTGNLLHCAILDCIEEACKHITGQKRNTKQNFLRFCPERKEKTLVLDGKMKFFN